MRENQRREQRAGYLLPPGRDRRRVRHLLGTADILLRFVADTPDAAWEAKKSGAYPDECTCAQPPEPVVILSDYGSEWWWLGGWCSRCRVIAGPCAPYACQVCHDSPYYSERHECVRVEMHDGLPVFPMKAEQV